MTRLHHTIVPVTFSGIMSYRSMGLDYIRHTCVVHTAAKNWTWVRINFMVITLKPRISILTSASGTHGWCVWKPLRLEGVSAWWFLARQSQRHSMNLWKVHKPLFDGVLYSNTSRCHSYLAALQDFPFCFLLEDAISLQICSRSKGWKDFIGTDCKCGHLHGKLPLWLQW